MSGAIADLFVQLTAKDEITPALGKVESGLSRVAGVAQSSVGKMSSVLQGATAGLVTAIASPVLSGLGGVFQTVSEGVMGTNMALQDSGTAWGVLLGSTDKAQAQLSRLFEFGAKTPFEFKEVDQAARVLQTFGVDVTTTSDNLNLVGNIAAGTGQHFGDVAMWVGRLYDNLQNGQPFGEAAQNLQEMGAMSGQTRLHLEQMQKDGASSAEMWDYFNQSVARFNQNGGMMAQMSQTMSGRLSTLHDDLNMVLATAGKPIFDVVSAGLGRFLGLLESPALMSFAERLAGGIASGLARVGSLFMALVPIVQGAFSAVVAIVRGLVNGDMQSAFLAVMHVIGQVFGPGAMAPVAGFVGTLMTRFWQLKDLAVAAFQGVVAFVTGTLIPTLGNIWNTLSSNFGRIAAVVGPFVAGFAGVLAAVGGVQAVFALLAAVAVPVISAIVGAVTFLLSPIGLVAVAVGLLAAAWMNNWGGIQGIVMGLIPTLQAVWTSIQTGLAVVLPIIMQLGQAFITNIVPAFQSFVATVQSVMAVVVPILTQVGQAIMAGIGGALAVIGPLFQGLAAQFMSQLPAIQGLWTQLQSAVAPIVPIIAGVAAIVGGVLVTAIGLVLGVFGGLVGFLTGALPGAIQMVSGIITALGGVFQVLAAVVTGVVQIVANVLQGNWSGAWQAALNMVQGVSAGMQTIVSGLGTAVLGFIQGMVGGVQGFISGMVAVVSGYFTSLASQAGGTVQSMVTAVGGFFSSLGSQVQGLVSGLVSAVTGFFHNMSTDAGGTVSGMVDAILGFLGNLSSQGAAALQSLSDSIMGTLGSLAGMAGSAAASIGNAIVDGIAGAISAGIGKVTDAAKSIAQTALSSAMGALGIHSPSKAFAELGYYTVAGYVQGITQNASLASKAVDQSLGALAGGPALSSPAFSRAGAAGAAGGTIVHLEVHGSVLSERDLREVVADQYNTLQRRGRI